MRSSLQPKESKLLNRVKASNPLLGWVDVTSDEMGGASFVVAGLYAEQPEEDIVIFDIGGEKNAGLLDARKTFDGKWLQNAPCNLQVEKTEDGYEARLMRSNGPSYDVMIAATGLKPEEAIEAVWSTVLDSVACYEQWFGFLAYSKANKGAINPFQLG